VGGNLAYLNGNIAHFFLLKLEKIPMCKFGRALQNILKFSGDLIFMFPCIMTQYTKMTKKMQLCRIIYYSFAALHVSSDIFVHHQEHLTL